jgi:hypothetical protein
MRINQEIGPSRAALCPTAASIHQSVITSWGVKVHVRGSGGASRPPPAAAKDAVAGAVRVSTSYIEL